MNAWHHRPAEERALLNPSFCSVLLWHAALGYELPLPVELAFVILPIVLHRETRESLPGKLTTSLAVWLNDNPLRRSQIADRATTLVDFSREALMFGGQHGLLRFQGVVIVANAERKKVVTSTLKDSSQEVLACVRRSEFTGRWLAKAGSPNTVMALLGVRP